VARKRKKPSTSGAVETRKSAAASGAKHGRPMQRRQVLKGVVAGSSVVASAMSLPKEWTKPVIQSIVASAQAQVSPPLAPLSPASPPTPPVAPTFLAPTMAPTAPPTMAPTINLGPAPP
jgi:hypothetical protein